MKKLNFIAGLAGLSLATFFSPAALANSYVVMLFDETGSMSVTRPADGLTRCEFGKRLFMQSVKTAIVRGDYLDVQTFGTPGSRRSLVGDFIDVRGLSPDFGPGKAHYDNIKAQIDSLQCRAPSTALGNALCEAMDQLKNEPNATTERRIGLLTDAGENSSDFCGNGSNSDPTAYVTNHIIPRAFAPPPVLLNLTILQPGGNVSRFSPSFRSIQELEYEAPKVPLRDLRSSKNRAILPITEAQALSNAAMASGGGATVVRDNQTCSSGCDPLSQDPDWGGIF